MSTAARSTGRRVCGHFRSDTGGRHATASRRSPPHAFAGVRWRDARCRHVRFRLMSHAPDTQTVFTGTCATVRSRPAVNRRRRMSNPMRPGSRCRGSPARVPRSPDGSRSAPRGARRGVFSRLVRIEVAARIDAPRAVALGLGMSFGAARRRETLGSVEFHRIGSRAAGFDRGSAQSSSSFPNRPIMPPASRKPSSASGLARPGPGPGAAAAGAGRSGTPAGGGV